MDKQAVLENVYQEAFNDELDKIAAMPGYKATVEALKKAYGASKGGIGKAVAAVKTQAGAEGAAIKGLGENISKLVKGDKGLGRGFHLQQIGAGLKNAPTAALGTAGVLGAGGYAAATR